MLSILLDNSEYMEGGGGGQGLVYDWVFPKVELNGAVMVFYMGP